MGLLLVADVIAAASGSLLLGAVVDRMGKRAVMLVADIARASVLGLLAWLAVEQLLAFWMLVLAAGASGLLTVLFELARSAWVAQRVDAHPAADAKCTDLGRKQLGRDGRICARRLVVSVAGSGAGAADRRGELFLSAIFLRGVQETPVADAASPAAP